MNETKNFMSDIELKTKVFKIIRANVTRGQSQILKIIKEQLPEIEEERILKSIQSLIN